MGGAYLRNQRPPGQDVNRDGNGASLGQGTGHIQAPGEDSFRGDGFEGDAYCLGPAARDVASGLGGEREGGDWVSGWGDKEKQDKHTPVVTHGCPR